MPIRPNGHAATPGDMNSLMDWCNRHTGSEKQVAIVAAMMAWNLACHVIEEDQAKIEAGNLELETIFYDLNASHD